MRFASIVYSIILVNCDWDFFNLVKKLAVQSQNLLATLKMLQKTQL